VEIQVDPLPGSSTEVVVHEMMIEDATPLWLAPMPKIGTLSRGGLELLDDELVLH
jgi:hypothetical protein